MITYETYSQKLFAEHARRQNSMRRAARLVRWTYPLFLVCFFVVPVVIVVQSMRLAYMYDLGRISELVSHQAFTDAMPFVYLVTGALAFFALLLGVMWGFAKAREYTFQAENLDLKTRQEYHLLCISKFLESVGQPVPAGTTAQMTQGSKDVAIPAPKSSAKQGASSAALSHDDPLSQIVIRSHDSDNDHEIRI